MLSPSPDEQAKETNNDIANGTSFLATGALDAVVRGMPPPWGGTTLQPIRRSQVAKYSQRGRQFMTLLVHSRNATWAM
jgi:hypothetical protein